MGGFYFGLYQPEVLNNKTLKHSGSIKSHLEVIPNECIWDTTKCIMNIENDKVITLINWLPVSDDSAMIYSKISAGKFDGYLKKCARCFREFAGPVFLNFAPGFDDKSKAWYANSSRSKEYVKAWQYIYTFFNDMGISNLTWIWSPKRSSSISYYPGPKFVDWVGFSVLNYGGDEVGNNGYSFSQLYKPLRKSYGVFQKPVMIYEFGTVNSASSFQWYKEALTEINSSFKEIHSVILYNKEQQFDTWHNGQISKMSFDFRIRNEKVLAVISEKLEQERFGEALLQQEHLRVKSDRAYRSPFISGTPGSFSLMVNAKPFYIRGVAYNTAHDWRDGNMPLTRKQVEKDFTMIREMGANTIRRYDQGVYDRNVLNIADEYNLKVMYGFWFDPKVDYYKDSARVREYMEDVEEKVLQFRDHTSVLAWSLGNETWGLLKHRYTKPYLTKVRDAYVKMIESLAQKIHQLDPSHPVFSCMEHEEYQIPGELVAFHDGAPSVDVMGVNSYYREQISKLNHLTWQFDSLRPYLVSEFGPRGYWDPKYNRVKNGSLVEDNDSEKATWYSEQWDKYVYAHKGFNVGGFAYCWHDRMEGSNTWFGLTDFKGRPKSSYYALKKAWTKGEDKLPEEFAIQAPENIKPGEKYVFKALSKKEDTSFKYEWYLHKDEFLSRIENVEIAENGKDAVVEIPVKPSDYRLYLYVSDKEGRVSTASVPVKVK
jgi:hypothetical protein